MKQLAKATIRDFGLTEEDLELANGTVKHKYNHVQQNIQLASKFAIVKDLHRQFKKTVLAKNNTQNLELIHEKQDKRHEQKRLRLIKRAKRWDDFRERRTQVQDLYSELRKKQTFAEMIIKQILLK